MSADHARAVTLVMAYCRDHVSTLTQELAETYLSRCEFDVIEAIQCLLRDSADNHASRDPTVISREALSTYLQQQAHYEAALLAEAEDQSLSERGHGVEDALDGPEAVSSTAVPLTPVTIGDTRELRTWKLTVLQLQKSIAALKVSATKDNQRFLELERMGRERDARCRDLEARVRASMRDMLNYIDEHSHNMPSGVYVGLANRARDVFKEASPDFDVYEDAGSASDDEPQDARLADAPRAASDPVMVQRRRQGLTPPLRSVPVAPVAPLGTRMREEQDIDLIISQTGTHLDRGQVRVVWHENNRDVENAIFDFADGDEAVYANYSEALTRAIFDPEYQYELAGGAGGREDPPRAAADPVMVQRRGQGLTPPLRSVPAAPVAPLGTQAREEQDIDLIISRTGTHLDRQQVRVVYNTSNRDVENAIMEFVDGGVANGMRAAQLRALAARTADPVRSRELFDQAARASFGVRPGESWAEHNRRVLGSERGIDDLEEVD